MSEVPLISSDKFSFLRKDNDNKNKFSFKNLFSKKYIKLFLLILCLIVILIILTSFMGEKRENETVESYNNSYLSTKEYCNELESKLQNVLSQIKGAGNVSVMISLDGSPELVYASDTNVKTTSGSTGTTSTNSSSPIIVNVNGNSSALILTENLPNVKGVIVVSSGANDVSVRLDILNAVTTLLNISSDKVSVLKGK